MTPPLTRYLNVAPRRWPVIATGACLAAGLASASSAWAESRKFDLPGGSLARALEQFAIQGGLSVGGLEGSGCRGAARPVAGQMSPAAALAALLPAECGFQTLDPRSFRIVRRADLSPVTAVVAPRRAVLPSTSHASVLEEVVVTAERRTEPWLESPFAVSALTSDQIQRLGGRSFDEIAAQVLGVSVTNLGSGRNKIFIRGLSDGSFTGKTQSTVGLYLGDVPITYNAPDPDLRLADIERVEVLRGPQGTLYGSGSIGGIVRIVAAVPDPSAIHAGVAVEGATTESGAPSSGLEAMMNVPMAEGRAAVRGVVYSDTRGGYIDNTRLSLKDVNSTRRTGGRLSLAVQIGAGWDLGVGVTHQSIHTADAQYVQDVTGDVLTRSTWVREPHNNNFTDVSAAVRHLGPVADLTISGAYITHDLRTLFDATGDFRTPAAPRGVAVFEEDLRARLAVAEAVWTSVAPGRTHWTAGLFASQSDETDDGVLTGLSPLVSRSAYRRRDQLDEAAAYGEISRDVASIWQATLGGRAFVSRVQTHADGFELARTSLDPIDARLIDRGIAPKVRLSWAPDRDRVVYAQVQQGYRAGGFNLPATVAGSGLPEPASPAFRADRLWSYEIGAASPLFDRRLYLRGALFRADWRNVQTDQYLPSGIPMTVNIGDGSNIGLELETIWRPSMAFQARFTGLLEDPQLTRAANVFPARADIGLPGVPRGMASISLRYRWLLPRGIDAQLLGQANYVGHSFLTFDGGSATAMGGYSTGRIAAELGASGWRLQAYVENLTDESANTFAYGNPFSRARAHQATPLRPRTAGLSLRWGF